MQYVFLVMLFILPDGTQERQIYMPESMEQCFKVAEKIRIDYSRLLEAYARENKQPEVPILTGIGCYYAEGESA